MRLRVDIIKTYYYWPPLMASTDLRLSTTLSIYLCLWLLWSVPIHTRFGPYPVATIPIHTRFGPYPGATPLRPYPLATGSLLVYQKKKHQTKEKKGRGGGGGGGEGALYAIKNTHACARRRALFAIRSTQEDTLSPSLFIFRSAVTD